MIAREDASLDDRFVCFRGDGLFWAAPMSAVERMEPWQAGQLEDGLPLLDLRTDTQRAVLLRLADSGHRLGVVADSVEGLVQVPPEEQLPLPAAVQDRGTRRLTGAFYWDERETLCFLTDCGALCAGEEPKGGAGIA